RPPRDVNHPPAPRAQAPRAQAPRAQAPRAENRRAENRRAETRTGAAPDRRRPGPAQARMNGHSAGRTPGYE
ncbi:hypothetical protein ACFWPY_39600, partial [Streptomyces sp. NPDC058527]